MYTNNTEKLPISFAMALSHNTDSLKAFFSLDNKAQDEIIKKAQSTKSLRQMQALVDKIAKQTPQGY